MTDQEANPPAVRQPGHPVRPGPRCSSCHRPLTTHWQVREGVCNRLECRGPYLQKQRTEHDRHERTAREALAAEAQALLAAGREKGLPLPVRHDALLLVVPHFEGRLAPQPAERIRRFTINLRQAMDAARRLAHMSSDTVRRTYESRDAGPLPPAIANACSTCRGACCRQGGEHAFLVASFLAWRLMNDPGLSAEAMIDEYLSRLPAESFDDSCVYHTPTGCALPRAIRGPTCNDFLCTGIVDRRDDLAADPDTPSLAAAYGDGRFLRVGWMDRGEPREEFDLPPM